MRSAATLCLLALVMAGCGGSAPRDSAKKFKGEQAKVAAVVEQIEKDARADKSGDVCAKLFTDARLAALKKLGTNCKTGVKDAFADADSFDLTVDAVTISGDTATAKVISSSGSHEETDTLSLKRDGTAWKVDSLRS